MGARQDPPSGSGPRRRGRAPTAYRRPGLHPDAETVLFPAEATVSAPPRPSEPQYGELSPRQRGGSCDLHNQTMTVTLFDEA